MIRSARGAAASSPRLLQLTAFVSTLDRFAMPPMLLTIARDLDISFASVVQAASAYFLAYGLMQPVWGMISDRLGVVRTMRLALALAVVATCGSALSWSAGSLLASRGLAGACFGAAIPATLIYVGDTVPAQLRQRDVTDVMIGVALGTTVASAGAGLVAQWLSWRAVFIATGLAALVLTAALSRLAEPPLLRTRARPLSALAAVMASGYARLVLALAFAEGMVLLGVVTLLPPAVEAAGSSAAVAGGVTAVFGIAVFGFAKAVGIVSPRLDPPWLLAGGAVAALVGCLAAAVSRSPAGALVACLLLGLAWASMHSTLQTWATEVLPSARATVVSLFAGSLFLGSAVWTVLVAGLAEQQRYDVIFVLAAALTVPLGVLSTYGRGRWRSAAH